jgi:hypothetical protein
VVDTLLQAIADDLGGRMRQNSLPFTVLYHTKSEQQWQRTCVAISHPWGFDARSRHRRFLKIIIDDGMIIITNASIPLRPPFPVLVSWSLSDPDFCLERVFERVVEILNMQNEVMWNGPA